MSSHKFTLVDVSGESHQYVTTKHNLDDGLEIISELMGLGITPLVEVMISASIGGGKIDTSTLNAARIGEDVRNALQGRALVRMSQLLLKNTFRDGQPLREKSNMNAAFQGNYFEMFQACWEVIEANGFFAAFGMLNATE